MPGSKTAKKTHKSSKQENGQSECIVPQSVFVPGYMFDSNDNLDLDVKLKEDDERHSFTSCNKTRFAFEYDDDTVSLTSVDSTSVHLHRC